LDPRLLLDLMEQVGRTPRGATVSVSWRRDLDRAALDAWCAGGGHTVLDVTAGSLTIRRGPGVDPYAGLPPQQRPGSRLWLYTNFDCNLACDYCCVRSSPATARSALGLDRIATLAAQAAAEGVRELLLTGGEPFLLPDLDAIAGACTEALPTTLLTNGMLLRGSGLARLRRMDRRRLVVQISLDAATPDAHDDHRGRGSWARAVAGIRVAAAEGFRVRVAATVPAGAMVARTEDLYRLLDELGIAAEDRIVRPVAERGAAGHGVRLSIDSLIPELTVTADGVWWHPVGAGHPDMLITRQILPLAEALAELHERFATVRARSDAAAQWFPCA